MGRSGVAEKAQIGKNCPSFRLNARIFLQFNEIRANRAARMQRGFLVPSDGLRSARLGLLIPKLACLGSHPRGNLENRPLRVLGSFDKAESVV